MLDAVDLDLGPAVLRVDDLVADRDVERDALALLEPARSDGHDFALLGLFLRGVGDDDPARGRLVVLLERADNDAVLERLQLEPLGHVRTPPRETVWKPALAL